MKSAVVPGMWPGLARPVLIDGYTRREAAIAAGIEQIPCVNERFESEVAALRHVILLQAKRRGTSDAMLVRLVERFDELMSRGRPRRNEEVTPQSSRRARRVRKNESPRRHKARKNTPENHWCLRVFVVRFSWVFSAISAPSAVGSLRPDANGERSLVELYDRQVYLSHLQARAVYEALGRILGSLQRLNERTEPQEAETEERIEEDGESS